MQPQAQYMTLPKRLAGHYKDQRGALLQNLNVFAAGLTEKDMAHMKEQVCVCVCMYVCMSAL